MRNFSKDTSFIQDSTFHTLFREQLGDLYDAEQQIVAELPRMARAAASPELKTAFELHCEQTREQVARLDRIFADLRMAVPRNTSDPMRALLARGRLLAIRYNMSPILDAALIAAAQQVEQYEISGYETARMLARMLNHERADALLGITLEEEQDTAGDLSEIAETVIMGDELEQAELEEAGAA